MRRSLALFTALSPLALFTLAGCGDSSDDGNTTASCTTAVTVKATYPADAATTAYWRGPYSFDLSAPDASAKITADFGGEQAQLDGGKTLTWTPITPLVPGSMHNVTLSYCGGTTAAPATVTKKITFTVSDLGTPVAAGTTLQGKTYAVTITGAHYAIGAGLGSLVDTLFTVPVLVNVSAVAGDKITLRSGIAKAGSNPPTQDFCSRTLDYPDGDFSKTPFFKFGPKDVAFNAMAGAFTVYGLTVQGTAKADGSAIGGASFEGTIDAEQIAPAAMLSATVICTTAEHEGTPCGACPTGSKQTCLHLLIDRLSGASVAGTVDEITMSDTDARCMH